MTNIGGDWVGSRRLTQDESLTELTERTKKYFDINADLKEKLKDDRFKGITKDDSNVCDELRDIFSQNTAEDMDFALVYNEYVIDLKNKILGEDLTYGDHEPIAPSKMLVNRGWSQGELTYLLKVKERTEKTGVAVSDKYLTERFNEYFGDKIGVRSKNSVWYMYNKVLETNPKGASGRK